MGTWIIVLVVIVIVAAAGYWYWTQSHPKPAAGFITPETQYASTPDTQS